MYACTALLVLLSSHCLLALCDSFLHSLHSPLTPCSLPTSRVVPLLPASPSVQVLYNLSTRLTPFMLCAFVCTSPFTGALHPALNFHPPYPASFPHPALQPLNLPNPVAPNLLALSALAGALQPAHLPPQGAAHGARLRQRHPHPHQPVPASAGRQHPAPAGGTTPPPGCTAAEAPVACSGQPAAHGPAQAGDRRGGGGR